MKLERYNEILAAIHGKQSRDSLTDIIKLFPECNMKTLGSIYAQDYQRKMKRTHKFHYHPNKMDEYYLWFCNETSKGSKQVLLNIAQSVDISPALLARIVLERHLIHTTFQGEQPPKSLVTQMMKDTTLITDPILALEVQLCLLTDDIYGPVTDSVKHSVGHEYEFLLDRELKKRNLAYLDEDVLRAKGYDKTPDCKLEVPIAVDGHVVNWIESKASFGDEDSHRMYLKDQFWSYWNRFGPGLVIYWFGFIDELDVNREKGIMLMDHFPEDIVRMKPDIL